jgi:hypothetical protein
MFVSKWFAMIGVEFIRDSAPLDCLLERLMDKRPKRSNLPLFGWQFMF